MRSVNVYDDTDDAIQKLCEELDLSEPEVVDELIDIAMSSGQGQMYMMF